MKRQTKKIQRKRRVRAKMLKSKNRPRLSVFRSNRYIYAQIIDDVKRKTLVSFSSKDLSKAEGKKDNLSIAKAVGEGLAKKAKVKKIKEVVFDRSGYKYHGRIKALAEGAREGGLKF
jgi:large subunit ribosomal protein L18